MSVACESWVGWGFNHPRFGSIQILDESSNLWLIEQHETGNEFWIQKNPKRTTKQHSQLMLREERSRRFWTELTVVEKVAESLARSATAN
jgi:hypothetical protein